MQRDAAPFRSEAFAEDLIEPLRADDSGLAWAAWTVVFASLLGIFWV